jgi:hypothetical protein
MREWTFRWKKRTTLSINLHLQRCRYNNTEAGIGKRMNTMLDPLPQAQNERNQNERKKINLFARVDGYGDHHFAWNLLSHML